MVCPYRGVSGGDHLAVSDAAPARRSPIMRRIMKRTGARVRIDRLLVDKGLVDSREKAARHILAGDVFVDSQRVDKAGALVASGAAGELLGRAPHVSRGGEKLVHPLDTLPIKGARGGWLGGGGSPLGVTHCPLPRGAAPVDR